MKIKGITMTVPFVRKEFSFTQPDGTIIKLRGSGDQHYIKYVLSRCRYI